MGYKGLMKNRKGQSVVETAIILPLIILILMGIFDFGMMFNNYLIISNASREGARSAAVGSSDYQIKTIVENVTSSLDQSKLSITIIPNQSLRKKGDEVTVIVKYNYSPITPVIAAIVSNSIKLDAMAVMRME